MVKSNFCHLNGLSSKEMVEKKEDHCNFGGFFIINGNERLIRMLIQQKRNYPIAFSRPTFINRGKNFTSYACSMRCVRDDFFAQTITLHYVSDGSISLRLMYLKQEFLIPIIAILRALIDCSDTLIYHAIVKNYNQLIADKVESIIQQGRDLNLYSPS